MFEALSLTPVALLSGVGVFTLFVVLLISKVKRAIQKQLEQSRLQVRKLDKELQKSSKQLLEVRSVVVGLGQKVTEQQDLIKHLNERIVELEHADNDGRLYTRATKMVQLGAGINELIEECELPKAEAELMMSLQNKLAGKEKIPSLRSDPTLFDEKPADSRDRRDSPRRR
ncbi:DUF2802 domain-containing protein [Vibrio kanaloae]|jgi:DNA repair exonuclease SbcCD ATPase subunit|uniref:DUF2802 domain-containing protein n=1 Tax=Vibrio TaxID=662 RepID=UPI00061A0888|nr:MULTISPECIES: DUF2802 domain-containing protein [Vibrio]NOI02513.1 DUF2802 domain-containing protein [Vibrio kanaloae]NOJ00616.1 DUF2802 domain-containing protein [Vibrio kanaloae]TKE96853.1 DUF2802 domain-containing protein [Vibrio kanaloae]TKF20861.1 DUF2802 domain-containing protein [Vibrio kanaloae]